MMSNACFVNFFMRNASITDPTLLMAEPNTASRSKAEDARKRMRRTTLLDFPIPRRALWRNQIKLRGLTSGTIREDDRSGCKRSRRQRCPLIHWQRQVACGQHAVGYPRSTGENNLPAFRLPGDSLADEDRGFRGENIGR